MTPADVAASTATSSGAPHDPANGGLNGTGAASGRSGGAGEPQRRAPADDVAREIAVEQAHVDRVHAELEKAGLRADSVQAEGLARSQFGRLVEVGDAEGAALFERDALMFHAAKRRRHSTRSTRVSSSVASTSTTACSATPASRTAGGQ